jgi:hypothetical protein
MFQFLQAYTPSMFEIVSCIGFVGFVFFLRWWGSLPLEDDGFGNENYKSQPMPRCVWCASICSYGQSACPRCGRVWADPAGGGR